MDKVIVQGTNLDFLLSPDLDPLFWTPVFLGRPSSWWGHIPFAFWITATCKPRIFVELGTHHGVSYSAFCESVARLELHTRCYALGDWKADDGIDGEDIYRDLKSFQNERYPSFSEILNTSLDDAHVLFENGSIDLLHIDGYGILDDVLLDFEIWLPKLSNRAIVLIHGFQRKDKSRAFAFFEELKKKNPSFEFLHGDGLGIVAVGSEVPPVIGELCSLKETKDLTLVRERFSRLGVACQLDTLVADKNAQIEHLQNQLGPANKQIWDLTNRLHGIDELVAQKEAKAAEYLYHLKRINASPWWRFGEAISDAVIKLSKFTRPYFKNEEAVVASPIVSIPNVIMLPAAADEPKVSVVILSYGHVDYTLRCLHSIAVRPPLSPLEIVVSDDCSGASDLGKLKNISHLKFLQPPQNLGFLKHANWAVAQTSGKFVLLLNNDTELKAGAIDALVETAQTVPNVGLVGSKLVYPDGRLQEAGGIVWNDASAWNYGHFDNPARSDYNYVRDVDYISGASILVPRAVWDQMDGFDEHFEPAYCEDSDLAFRLRREGFRVLYQPRSVVVHHEGVTHGTDLTSGVKAYQVVNQARFKERWSSVLQAEQYPNGEHVLRARDRSKRGRVMLMIDHYVPEPDRDAGSRTIMELIKSLHAEGWVIKFWPENLRYSPVYTPLLQQMGVEVMYEPWTFSFNDWISKNGDEIDLIFLSRPGVAQNFLRALRKFIPDTPIIFYGHDLHAQRIRMQSRLNNDPRLATEADAMEVIERRVWRKVDLVLYPSKEEVDVIKQLEPDVEARVLLPFCYDVFKPLRSPPAVPILLFVAGFAHSPNIDAALWLCHEIMPLVRREVPLVTLWIVGSNPAYAVTQLANDFTKVTGYVTEYELELRYAQARVAIAPLRIGAGLKLKVVEAMQQGLPLVTTSVGAQGLEKLGEAAKVADEAEELAMELIQLLRDDDAWTEQARRQLEYVQQHFSRQASVKAIADATSAAISNAEKRKRSRPSVVSASPWLWMKRLTKSGR